MADIICPKCEHKFDKNTPESKVTRAALIALFAAGGFSFGGILGAVVGGGAGWFLADQFRRCPKCSHIFKRKRP
jgi:hypothetical protein